MNPLLRPRPPCVPSHLHSPVPMLAQREAGSLSRLQVTNGLREGGGRVGGRGRLNCWSRNPHCCGCGSAIFTAERTWVTNVMWGIYHRRLARLDRFICPPAAHSAHPLVNFETAGSVPIRPHVCLRRPARVRPLNRPRISGTWV